LEKVELVDQILTQLKRMRQMQMQLAFESWRKLDVPLAQLKSLFLIHVSGSLTSRALAAHLRVTPGGVTSIVDRLVGQGLLARGGDPEDRRLVMLELTEKGRKLIADIHVTNMSNMKAALNRMSRDDVAALHRGISAMLAVIEEDNKGLTDDDHTPEHCHGVPGGPLL
jgi:DNA-binding MarR family transcriptional regulator